MINFLGNVVMFFMALSAAIIFACISVLGLAVLDYALDSDIKGGLTAALGPRHFLKKLRIKVLELFKKYDTPSQKDLMDISYDIDPDDIIWRGGEDYDAEIHRLIVEISKDAERERNKDGEIHSDSL